MPLPTSVKLQITLGSLLIDQEPVETRYSASRVAGRARRFRTSITMPAIRVARPRAKTIMLKVRFFGVEEAFNEDSDECLDAADEADEVDEVDVVGEVGVVLAEDSTNLAFAGSGGFFSGCSDPRTILLMTSASEGIFFFIVPL